ncbi:MULTISPECIES: hypothetical protein [unclassified Flavobacterium]|uniref:hypothetical protein n=1 Tax=unclassified Flavobacterium TaxID=196869 RepID=UPI000F0CEA97|nr:MULTISPECIES: hypothetical protein [unclassified Flavobacterium]AYN03206.1 hypothetical protein EAG11_02755 [Flavobacterium sp. 140616W15]MCD0474878.1 hypothetical protein [Flavobacterium sp. EDS]
MRNLLILFLFLSNICFAQKLSNYLGFDLITHNSSIVSLQGTWGISQLIVNPDITEYSLSQQTLDRSDNYRNYITLNANQTFVCGYSAKCGSGCFTRILGKYKIIDENYICFYIDKITGYGDCFGDSEPNKDFGLYYYHKFDDGFLLLKSTGSIENDKQNIEYRNLIVANYSEIRNFDNTSLTHLMNRCKQTDLKEDSDIIAFCMAENQIKDYELLYLMKSDQYKSSFKALLKVNGEFRYVIYDEGSKQVILYDDSQIKNIDRLIKEINDIKTLKKKCFKEPYDPKTITSDKNTITIYKKKKEIYKIVYVQYNQNSEIPYTKIIYFQNSKPICIESLRNTNDKENKQIPQMVIYVLDWEENKVVNKIETETRYISTSIYREKIVINRIMEVINKQGL